MERADNLSRAGFSLQDGWKIMVSHRMTIRRGEVVFENGKITAAAGSGRFAPAGLIRPIRQNR